MNAYNCNPRRTILGIYSLFLLCNPSLELSTWQGVIDFLLDTQYIQQTGYTRVGCKSENWDTCASNYRPFKQRLEVNVKDWYFGKNKSEYIYELNVYLTVTLNIFDCFYILVYCIKLVITLLRTKFKLKTISHNIISIVTIKGTLTCTFISDIIFSCH